MGNCVSNKEKGAENKDSANKKPPQSSTTLEVKTKSDLVEEAPVKAAAPASKIEKENVQAAAAPE